MSYALITGGGPDGRYTIQLDWGEAQKAALLAQVAAAQATLTTKLAEQQTHVDEADALEAESLAGVQAMQDALITIAQEVGYEAVGDGLKKLYDYVLDKHRKLVLRHQPVRDAMKTLKAQMAQSVAMGAYWNNFSASETRQAWCCDLTENASGYVATVDVPGEDNLMLIAPGGRSWTAADGVLAARELMSPAQAYFNAAILPGWQKWKPTYRWGVASDVDADANTMTVTLGPATSSAQGLNVNAASVLRDVPVTYLTCDANAFVDGDRVVVQFENQLQSSPRVIGFLDNPRACSGTVAIKRLAIYSNASAVGSKTTSDYSFVFLDSPAASLLIEDNYLAITCFARVNRGAWFQLRLLTPFGPVWVAGETGDGGISFGMDMALDERRLTLILTYGWSSYESPYVPQADDIVEARMEFGGNVIHNIAAQILPIGGLSYTEVVTGGNTNRSYTGATGWVRTLTASQVPAGAANGVKELSGYKLGTA